MIHYPTKRERFKISLIRKLKKSRLFRRVYERLEPCLFTLYSIFLYFHKYRKCKALPKVKIGVEEDVTRVPPDDPAYLRIFERISDAYIKAKKDQGNVGSAYQVSPMWQSFLDDRFGDLSKCLLEKNIKSLQTLLENFHKHEFTFGSGASSDDYFRIKKNRFYKYQFVNTWYEYYNVLQSLLGNPPQLHYPPLGNPMGLLHNGHIIPIEALRYFYYSVEMRSFLQGIDCPIICEIGGGVGGQAYTVLSNADRKFIYILLDIPEMLVIAAYFLVAAFRKKKFLLYGEDAFDSQHLDQFDVILMPHFFLPELGDETVDLFFNSCSFAEMNRDTVEEYLRQINRICRKYLMHINHDFKFEWVDNGKTITNMPGCEIIPDPHRFRRIYKHPRLFARLEDKYMYYLHEAGHFTYLYEKTRNKNKTSD